MKKTLSVLCVILIGYIQLHVSGLVLVMLFITICSPVFFNNSSSKTGLFCSYWYLMILQLNISEILIFSSQMKVTISTGMLFSNPINATSDQCHFYKKQYLHAISKE